MEVQQMKPLQIGGRLVGVGYPCYIIAEAGINHNGDLDLAKKLVAAAAEAGADAVKFQTHIPEKEMMQNTVTADYVGEPLFDLLKRVELSRQDHIELMEYAAGKGILFLSTPFSREAADLLEEIGVVAYKIGSGEMTNLPLLEHVAGKKKPVIISTGMSTLEEIEGSVNFLKKLGCGFMLLHCTSTYPTNYEDINLNVMGHLRERFVVPVGLSDHSTGIYVALASVALGACLIEKHFTLDRDLPGPDQKSSITPEELAELVRGVRAVEKAMGSVKRVTEGELPIQKMARESVVSLVDIPAGTVIGESMVWVKRPGGGIPAKDLYRVIGMRAREDIRANTLINWSDLQ